MAFEPGNQLRLGTKSPKLVQEVIKRAIIQDDSKRLRQAIEAQLDLAAAGDLPALTFIRDTVEGKPAQAVTVSGDEDAPLVSMIKMVVVQANSNQFNELSTLHGETVKEIPQVESNPSLPTHSPLVGHLSEVG
jgi:hypothetical protein